MHSFPLRLPPCKTLYLQYTYTHTHRHNLRPIYLKYNSTTFVYHHNSTTNHQACQQCTFQSSHLMQQQSVSCFFPCVSSSFPLLTPICSTILLLLQMLRRSSLSRLYGTFRSHQRVTDTAWVSSSNSGGQHSHCLPRPNNICRCIQPTAGMQNVTCPLFTYTRSASLRHKSYYFQKCFMVPKSLCVR